MRQIFESCAESFNCAKCDANILIFTISMLPDFDCDFGWCIDIKNFMEQNSFLHAKIDIFDTSVEKGAFLNEALFFGHDKGKKGVMSFAVFSTSEASAGSNTSVALARARPKGPSVKAPSTRILNNIFRHGFLPRRHFKTTYSA